MLNTKRPFVVIAPKTLYNYGVDTKCDPKGSVDPGTVGVHEVSNLSVQRCPGGLTTWCYSWQAIEAFRDRVCLEAVGHLGCVLRGCSSLWFLLCPSLCVLGTSGWVALLYHHVRPHQTQPSLTKTFQIHLSPIKGVLPRYLCDSRDWHDATVCTLHRETRGIQADDLKYNRRIAWVSSEERPFDKTLGWAPSNRGTLKAPLELSPADSGKWL